MKVERFNFDDLSGVHVSKSPINYGQVTDIVVNKQCNRFPILFEVYFPFHDEVKSLYKDKMVDTYNNEIEEYEKNGGHNVPFREKEFIDFISDKYKTALGGIFEYEKQEEIRCEPWLYVQTVKKSTNYWHNHIHAGTSITSTFYLDPPEKSGEGGEIELFVMPQFSGNTENTTVKYLPKRDHIYFFPSWLMHKPLRHNTDTTRVCVNTDFYTEKKPIINEQLLTDNGYFFNNPINW